MVIVFSVLFSRRRCGSLSSGLTGRRKYLRHYAMLYRLQDRDLPSMASPCDRQRCHRRFC